MNLLPRLAVVGALTVLALVALPAFPASAHITVVADHAEQGGFAVLTVRVPNEAARAATTQVRLLLPEETPLAVVRVKPHPGWKAALTRSAPGEAVTSVTWTADAGTGVGPDEFEEFQLSAGPLPTTDELVLAATQTYDDGTTVRWDERSADGTTTLDHPAPVLFLSPPSATESPGAQEARPGGHALGSHGVRRPSSQENSPDVGPGVGPAPWLGLAGLASGLLGLVVAVTTALSARRNE
ncbi:YcnI family copper-binding membrane protein [Streptosporangium saharense]|uniref:YcnI family copper-binding membrane protein n=1 Tax=Streptosporangium saharense TaxID=1706840 RepID=UPI00331A7D85